MAGAAVMATGIVSVGSHLIDLEAVSIVLLCLAAALWVLLAAAFAAQLLGDREHWNREADTPPALTAVAATAVLGTRIALLGWRAVAAALLVVAALTWPVLIVAVLRHLARRMPGGVFLVCVATQGLAVLAATLGGTWLDRAALVMFCLGLLLYPPTLRRFDLRQVVQGQGDQWVAGGALAISALAGSKLVASPAFTGWAHTALSAITLVLLALALVWYAVLLAAEIRRPRVDYDIRRWATVFPLGMTAVAALSVAGPLSLPSLRTLGQILVWVSLGAWLITAATAARQLTAHR